MVTPTPERTVEYDEVRIREPLWGVKSRVSWGALLAGAVVAVAVYSLLALLGVAVGVTISDRYSAEQLGKVAAYWTFGTFLVAMFFGGWISTRCTAGEFRNEAMLYGVIVWAITSSVLIPLTALGISTSSGAVLASRGIAKAENEIIPNAERVGQQAMDSLKDKAQGVADRLEQHAKRAIDNVAKSENSESSSKVTSENSKSSDDEKSSSKDKESDSEQSSKATATSSAGSQDNSSRASDDRSSSRTERMTQQAREKLQSASWWAFGGTFASLLAAVFGAMMGPSISVVHRKVPVQTVSGAVVRPVV